MIEQETAGIIRFIRDTLSEAVAYFWDIPQGFQMPAVYFLAPEADSAGDTLSTYRLNYIMYVKLFAETTQQAQSMAIRTLNAIRQCGNLIPLYKEDGTAEGFGFRLRDPQIKPVDTGVYQLTLQWNSEREYKEGSATKAKEIHINLTLNG